MSASLPVTLQVASVNDLSSDAYLAIPRSTLGTDYMVVSFLHTEPSRFKQGPSQFVVIASEDDTKVNIQLPNSNYTLLTELFRLPPDQVEATITLNEFEAYQVSFCQIIIFAAHILQQKTIPVQTSLSSGKSIHPSIHLEENSLFVRNDHT